MKLFILAITVALAAADVSHVVRSGSEKDAQIQSQSLDVGVNGAYSYEYKTDNGISASENGALHTVGDTEAEVVQGQASWTSPEGEAVQFSYVADENGYQPQGSHLPTSPPIPEAIIRSLEYIRAHPPSPERK